MKLTYNQLRQILGTLITSDPVRTSISDLLTQPAAIDEMQLIDLIYQSNIDAEIINILGYDPVTIDAIEGMEVILSFFEYMRSNSAKLNGWLSSFASQKTQNKPQNTN